MQTKRPPTLEHDAEQDDSPGIAFLTRFGTVVGGGVLAALGASLPAVMRIGDGGSVGRALELWMALAAILTPVAIATVGILRQARIGIRILAGPNAAVLAASVMWWAALEAGVLAVFGALLRAKTHHHGLAGVTFAVFALISGLVVALLAVRGGRMLLAAPELTQRIALVVTAMATFAILMLAGVKTARAEGLHTAAAQVDVLALIVAGAIASAPGFARARPFAIAGVPVAVLVLIVGFTTFHGDTVLEKTIGETAPVHAWLVELVR
jgi:hypothetical protein